MAEKTPFFSMFRARPRDIRVGSRQRGYDRSWEKLRARFIATNPLCAHCDAAGLVTPATEVDHIRPFDGLADPLRLAWNNLQSLCHSCHVTKTHRDMKGGE